MGLPNYIADVLLQRGQEQIETHPDDPQLAVVLEFYVNFLDKKQDIVIVHSKEVNITAGDINDFYGLQDFNDEYIPFT